MQQVCLKNDDTYQIVWVDKRVCVGDQCTLKGLPTVYDVVAVYDERDVHEINRKWNVGGLE